LIYLDTSALVKLLLPEPESASLRGWLSARASAPRISSALAEVEVSRAVRVAATEGRVRAGRLSAALASAEAIIAGLQLIAVDKRVLRAAASLPSPRLRSLDAVHVATASLYAGALQALVSYDVRMLAAGAGEGLPTASPG